MRDRRRPRRDAATQQPTAREFANKVSASRNVVPNEPVPRTSNPTRCRMSMNKIKANTGACIRENLNLDPGSLPRESHRSALCVPTIGLDLPTSTPYSGSSIGQTKKTLNSICPNFETLVTQPAELGAQLKAQNMEPAARLGESRRVVDHIARAQTMKSLANNRPNIGNDRGKDLRWRRRPVSTRAGNRRSRRCKSRRFASE